MRNWLVPQLFRWLGLLPLSWARALGTGAGRVLGLTNARAVRATRDNLAHCFPELSEAERHRLLRESLVETAKTGAEMGAIWRRPYAWLEQHVLEVEGEALLKERLAAGRGLILLAPHLGNWEVVAPFVARYAPLTALYQPLPWPALNQLVFTGRSKNGIRMAPTSHRGVVQLLKALRRSEMVGILPDQMPEPDSGGEVAPFFGQPALTMTLVHNLLRRTGSLALCIWAERVEGGFRVVLQEPAPGLDSADESESLAALNASVEACVRRAPAQYQWEYKRFRRLPEGYPQPYRR